MDKDFDFDKTFESLLKTSKENFKDVDEHFLRISIYDYIYSDLLGYNLKTEHNEDYEKAKAQYKIFSYESI
jgi:hypothetical protein